jgi:glycosyltransferase involved in cell wall biosynthesis
VSGRPMRVVIDGVPVRGTSLGIVVENLLKGWDQLGTDDDMHIVVGPEAQLDLPSSVTVHSTGSGRMSLARRLRVQNVTVPKLCRQLDANIMLGVIPATTIGPMPCPRALIAHDLRYQLRRRQFSTKSRLLRRASYTVGYRQADAIACVSERTRQDLLHAHPWLRRRLVEVTPHGADHVLGWPAKESGEFFALAFGQWGNKNVDLVIEAWALLDARGEALPLVLVGLPAEARSAVQAKVDGLGLTRLVTVLPWLDASSFHQQFASAGLVVFPSEFEGFGLPAVEAMRLGIPLVITPDPALLEVTAGHATVMEDWNAEALARAVPVARQISPEDLARATSHADEFTWRRTAAAVRSTLERCLEQGGRAPLPTDTITPGIDACCDA